MYYGNMYDKMLFIVMLCSSFFNVSYNAGVNKKVSFFKLLGWVFFLPFILCSSTFIFSVNTPINLMLSFSEFCLSAGIFLIILIPYKIKSHKHMAFIIFASAVILAVYTTKTPQFIYYGLSVKMRYILTAACIGAAVALNKKREGDTKLNILLYVWLAVILSGFFEDKQYVRESILIAKLCFNIAFSYYFYSTINSAYMEKINESQKIIERMEHSLHTEVKKRVFEIEKSNEKLLEISKTDLLTKTLNKITILNIIEKLITSKREKVFSILMFDIDDFKTINDTLGHIAGDLCLRTLAIIASNNIREVDYIGRYGGDEFIIVLPNLAENEAQFVAERFRNKVNETSNPKLTVSIGIATYPRDGETVKDLLSAADKALYKSKSKGKNTISHA